MIAQMDRDYLASGVGLNKLSLHPALDALFRETMTRLGYDTP